MLDSHLSYQRGNTLMWGFTLRTNFNEMVNHHLDDPRHTVKAQQASTAGVEPDWQQIAKDLERNAGWSNPAIYHDQNTVTVVAEQKKYRNAQEANVRASAIVANAVPDATELKITARRQQLPIEETTVDLTQFRHQQTAAVLGEPAAEPPKVTTPTLPQGVSVRDGGRQRLDYSWSPHLAQSFGGPESFYMFQIGINGNADLALTDKLWASGTLYLNLTDNYDKFNYTTPSGSDALPRVRTYIREYVSSSNVLMNNLQLTTMDKLAPEWYAQAYGGYLEMMYAGVGSEVLYRPYGQSWALGLDGNYVQQRDWNNTLKLADYKVATGHLTAYWELPYIDDTLAQISVGRYLAKDIGTTINLSRKFDSGVVAGVFAVFTDVSSEEYGEGSFNKGVYFTIPFDFLQVRPTVRQGTISWIPLTRDGGQMLSRKYGLYTISKPENK